MTLQLPIRDPLLTLCHLACEEGMDSILRQSCLLACQLFDVDCVEVLLVDSLGLQVVPLGGVHFGNANWSSDRQACIIMDDHKANGAVAQAVLSGKPIYQQGEYFVPLFRKDKTVLGLFALKTLAPKRLFDCFSKHEVVLLLKAMSTLIAKSIRHDQSMRQSQDLSISLQKSDQTRSSLKEQIRDGLASRIWGDSPQILRVRDDVIRFASQAYDFTVLGPDGSYKERIAMEVFNLSSKATSPFMFVNCKELTADTFAPLLFGYKRGAIIGVAGARKGYLSLAGQGLIYFDRVDALSNDLQERLERVLETRSYKPLGSERMHSFTARCSFSLCDTEGLEADLRSKMLPSFYNRVTQHVIKAPSLKTRREDIATIVEHLLGAQSRKHKTDFRMSPDIIVWLSAQDFNGDLRELESLIERAVLRAISHKRTILLRDFQDELFEEEHEENDTSQQVSLKEMIENYEKNIITQSLKRHNNSRDLSAKELNIPKRTLADKCKKYQLV